MTTVYFIRHAQSDYTVRGPMTRPLTAKGLADRRLVTEYLRDARVDAVLSSPFKRAVDTVSAFAEYRGLEVETIDGFRERRSDSDWDRDSDFAAFLKRQWDDFSYTLSDGERLGEVQARNVAALEGVLSAHEGETVVIGTHGMALSTLINRYDPSYGYGDCMAMLDLMPWAVCMDFTGRDFAGMEKTDLFHPDRKPDYSKCEVATAGVGELKAYRFVVIFARCRGKWLYCRARDRDVFETAGGRIERGETPCEAARRELYEETGALAYDIRPAFDYSVRLPSAYSFGQVFLAEIHELGDMPDYEMAEVRLFDTIPDAMRFPAILPVLYERIIAAVPREG